MEGMAAGIRGGPRYKLRNVRRQRCYEKKVVEYFEWLLSENNE